MKESADILRSHAEPVPCTLVHLFPQPNLGQRLQLAIGQDLQAELDQGKARLAGDRVGAELLARPCATRQRYVVGVHESRHT